MNKVRENLLTVLERMAEQARECDETTHVYAAVLDDALDGLLAEDFFGTEGQSDPRGDQHASEFAIRRSIEEVE